MNQNIGQKFGTPLEIRCPRLQIGKDLDNQQGLFGQQADRQIRLPFDLTFTEIPLLHRDPLIGKPFPEIGAIPAQDPFLLLGGICS